MKKQQHSQPSASLGLSKGFRAYLYLTAGVTGAMILIIEILGAKLLSPYLGTSHYVWTAQIGVTLGALAVGYYLGGWASDRWPGLDRMYMGILAAGVYLSLTVGVVERVAYGFLRFDLALGSVLTSTFLFFPPLTLLAAVGPFTVRALTLRLSEVGGLVGRISGVSTAGSMLGTLLIGYVLIPYLPNSVLLYATAGMLIAVVIGYFLLCRRDWQRLALVGAVGLAAAAAGYAGILRERSARWEGVRELYRANSNFGLIQVIEDRQGERRFYLNDYLTQNTYNPERGRSLSMFTYMLHDLALVFTPEVNKALCIGLGVGIVPMEFAREGIQVDVVEINPSIVPVAHEFFGLDPSLLNIYLGDGRYFLNQTRQKYDTIVLDAFLGDSSPAHLMSKEAFEKMRAALAENGTLVINSFGSFEHGHDFFMKALHQTLNAVFASVQIHASGNGNVFWVASDRVPLAPLRQPDYSRMPPGLEWQVRSAIERPLVMDLSGGTLLTDDFNPLEAFDAQNRERLRKQLAFSMRPE